MTLHTNSVRSVGGDTDCKSLTEGGHERLWEVEKVALILSDSNRAALLSNAVSDADASKAHSTASPVNVNIRRVN